MKMITVLEIKEREARREARREQLIQAKKRRKIKKCAKKIVKLRANGVKEFKYYSRLGKEVLELDGLKCYGENTLYRELCRLGIKLTFSTNDDLIRIII